jgi:cell division protein FtsW
MGVRITPSELTKLGLIIFTAAFLADKPERIRMFTTGLAPLFGIMSVYAGLIIKQPNLSTALVICFIMVAIMFIAGLHWGYIVGLLGIFSVGMMYILSFKQDTEWYARLTNFMDPFANKLGEGYQVSQSLIALGNGGVTGRGLGDSITKYLYLPEPQNDFILAIIGEELGFIGIATMMICYLILIYRGLLIAVKAKDKAGMLLASGITMMLAFQVIINVAVVTASMPATGITLPFISYGGTSLVVFLISMGMLLNISRKDSKKA